MTKNLMTGVGGQWGHSKITFWSFFFVPELFFTIHHLLVGFVLIQEVGRYLGEL